MRQSGRGSHARAVTAPNPDALKKFLDNHVPQSAGARGFITFASPPFRPAATLKGGSGGGFGTGGGFGSTGGFHTKRLAPWEENLVIPLDPLAPPIMEQLMPKEKPSQWAPSVYATAVAHTVNKIRADLEGKPALRAIVDESLCAPDVQPSKGGPFLIMEPEHFAFHRVTVPPPVRVQPPESYGKPPDAFWTPEERRTLLEFETAKRAADNFLGQDRHRQMRTIAIMQRRYPKGVVGVESANTEGTVVYAADRRVNMLAAQAASERHQQRVNWRVQNGRSEPHLGYDFLTTVPADFVPAVGAPEQQMPITIAIDGTTDRWRSKGRGQPPPSSISNRQQASAGSGESRGGGHRARGRRPLDGRTP